MTDTNEFKVATPRMASGLLLQDPDGLVLLVKPTYKDGWDLPGGYVEPGESPLQACRREVQEELGITAPSVRLLAVDWAPHPDEGDKVLWIFYGGEVPHQTLAATQLQESEIAEARFWPQDSLDQLMPPRLSRRLHAALSAIDRNDVAYLENGSPQPD